MTGGWKLIGVVDNGYNIIINISLTYSLVNTSKTVFNMNALRIAIDKSILNCYNVDFYDSIFEFVSVKSNLDNFPSHGLVTQRKLLNKVRLRINSRVIAALSQRNRDEHLLQIKEPSLLPGVYARVNKIDGSEVYINSNYVSKIISGYDRNTIPHELGHSLGLLHVDQNIHKFSFWGFRSEQYWKPDKQRQSSTNVMFSGNSPYMNDSLSTRITISQVKRLIYNIKKNRVNK